MNLGTPPVALFTDLYELTMGAALHAAGRDGEQATSELFVRSLPPRRGFLVAAGIEAALDGLEAWTYDDAACDWLASTGRLPAAFVERLRGLRFSGEVRAVAEGEVVFAGEPLVEVSAPLLEVQLVETYLLNVVGFETMVASKAARVALAAEGRTFVDFAARRAHGLDAAMRVARAAWVAGAAGTSLVAAGQADGLPLAGTMAHAYVMVHDDEQDAFRSFLRTFPEGATLLVDTYDTVEGARRAAAAAQELAGEGVRLAAVRLDSGDLGALAVEVRAVLDAAGLPDVRIVASGDLDEDAVAALVAAGAPIDSFGVGTRMGTSADHPWLSVVYKLVEVGGVPRLKLSEGKATRPGRKQVHRHVGGGPGGDVVALLDEAPPPGTRPLLSDRLRDGRRTAPRPSLDEARARCREGLAALAPHLRALDPTGPPHPVEPSPALAALTASVAEALTATPSSGSGRPRPHP